ncbi:hypothetical protein QJQ45_019298 [Haematococcus lacustris]|nr:hypothetical protein QJQ45_019298 [Haematococcus lacustris]
MTEAADIDTAQLVWERRRWLGAARLGGRNTEYRLDFVKRRKWIHRQHAVSVKQTAKASRACAVQLLTPPELLARQQDALRKYREGVAEVFSILPALNSSTSFKSLAAALLDPVALSTVYTCLRRLPRGPQAVSPGVGHAGTIAYAVRKEPIEDRRAEPCPRIKHATRPPTSALPRHRSPVRSINSVCAGSVNALRTPAQEACQPTQQDTAVRKHMLQRLETVLQRACPDLDLAVCGQLHVGRMEPKLVKKMFGLNAPLPDQAIPLVSPVFPDLYRLVKQWAKAQDINDACAGTFNSHCLAMITMSQQPAQEAPRLLAHGQPLDATVGALDVLKARVGGASQALSGACQGLAQPLLAHFKGLLACMDSLLQRTVQEQTGCVLVSVWLGHLEVSSRTTQGAIRHLVVEEPFDASDNCARTFAWRATDEQPWSLHYVADVFRRSSTLLSDAAAGKVSVPLALAALFGPSGLVNPPLAPVLAPLVTGTEALREVLAALVTAHHAKQPLMPAHRELLQLLLEQGTGPASTGDGGGSEQEPGEDKGAKELTDPPAAAPAPPVGAATPQAGGPGMPEGVSLDTLIPAYSGSGLAGFKKHHSKPVAQQQRLAKGRGPLPSQATASQGVVPALHPLPTSAAVPEPGQGPHHPLPTSAAVAVPEPGQGPGPGPEPEPGQGQGPRPNPTVASGGAAAPGLASEAQLAASSCEAPTASLTAATTALNPTLHQPAPRPPPQPSPAQQQRQQRKHQSIKPSDPSMAERDESIAQALPFASIASGQLQGQGRAVGNAPLLNPWAMPYPLQAHAPSSVAPAGQGLNSLHTDLRLGLDSSVPAAPGAPPHSAAAASMAAKGQGVQACTQQQQQYSQHTGGSAPSQQHLPHATRSYQPVLDTNQPVLEWHLAKERAGQTAQPNGLPEEQQAVSSLGQGMSLGFKGRSKQPRHGCDSRRSAPKGAGPSGADSARWRRKGEGPGQEALVS